MQFDAHQVSVVTALIRAEAFKCFFDLGGRKHWGASHLDDKLASELWAAKGVRQRFDAVASSDLSQPGICIYIYIYIYI